MDPQPYARRTARPVPLLLAAALVALQGTALVVFAVIELAHFDKDRATLAITTALFFVAAGAGLALCARGLYTLQSWARGPVVALDLLGILTGFSFWGNGTKTIAVALVAVCAVTVGAVLAPATTAALADPDGPDDQD